MPAQIQTGPDHGSLPNSTMENFVTAHDISNIYELVIAVWHAHDTLVDSLVDVVSDDHENSQTIVARD